MTLKNEWLHIFVQKLKSADEEANSKAKQKKGRFNKPGKGRLWCKTIHVIFLLISYNNEKFHLNLVNEETGITGDYFNGVLRARW